MLPVLVVLGIVYRLERRCCCLPLLNCTSQMDRLQHLLARAIRVGSNVDVDNASSSQYPVQSKTSSTSGHPHANSDSLPVRKKHCSRWDPSPLTSSISCECAQVSSLSRRTERYHFETDPSKHLTMDRLSTPTDSAENVRLTKLIVTPIL